MRLDVPKFSVSDPESWIFSINEYFTLLAAPADQRLRIVGFNLEGDAAEWFRWMTRNRLIDTWDRFLESVTEISENLLISFYVSGLKPNLQRELLISKPTSLGDAFSLARVTEARLEDQALLPTPSKEGINAGGAPLAIKWISPAERQERLNDEEPITETTQGDVVERGDISILNSLVGHGSPRSLQLWGSLGSGKVHVLIDNGSTHNFVQPGVVERMQLPITDTKPFKVYIGSGETLLCEKSMCPGRGYTLRGDEALRMKWISLHHMHALLATDDIYGVYELYNMAHLDEDRDDKTEATPSVHSDIAQLLAQFESLFQGIIQVSQSLFSSLVLLVKKKDGSYRKNYNSISIEGPFVTVGNLKNMINESKIFRTRNSRYVKDVLVVVDAQSNQEYVDDQTLIPNCTSLVICRFPRFPYKPIVLFQETTNEEEDSMISIAEDKLLYGTDFDDFGEDLFEVPKAAPLILGNPASPLRKTQALANIAALDRPQTTGGGFVCSLAGKGDGRETYEWLKPPKGYVCHRCNIPGHFIQHCPTNGDPNFDIKRVIPPSGIPKSMLGVHAKTNGSVMKPNLAAFEMEMEGIVSTCDVSDLPELNCPLCKQVMKDAALTSKCCFRSIRDQFISKRTCVCGATDRLADELLPNKTLRETINGRIETKCNSAGSRDQANKKKRKKADSHMSEMQGPTPPNSNMHPYYMAAYCNGQFGVPGMKPPTTGLHRDIGEPGMRMNDGAPTTSREESNACKSDSRQKHGLKRGVQRSGIGKAIFNRIISQIWNNIRVLGLDGVIGVHSRESSKDQESRKEVRSSADVTSSKDQESRRSRKEVISSADVTSKKLKRVPTTPPRASSKRRSSSRGDEYDDHYRHHKRH
ncbi:E3 ubiquitin ligase PQT3-like protein isoform X1 [Tanacetum coccineum]